MRKEVDSHELLTYNHRIIDRYHILLNSRLAFRFERGGGQ